jgi:chorismate dehydratase
MIKTKDSSVTLYSEKYSEHYHSTSGALEESLKKFIEPCNIKDNFLILDIGFGLGYNCLMALHNSKVKIISLEKEIVKEIQTIEVPDYLKKDYEKIKQAAKTLKYKDEIRIILGSAESTIKKLNEKFDAVFLDPFSPKKNPELWTLEFFRDIYSLMKHNSILATYSCASLVRKNLKEAGFKVLDGPCIGRRSPSTIAIKQ